ncbi:MAG: SAF domain-containing protein [Gammaproteobacteria bacterium]|nr:SAF domain-containing protein [Gammaproteobacteria bacterium]
MVLYQQLKQREDNPLRVGLIGAGKFGSMYLAQAHRTPGVHVAAIADLDVPRVHGTLRRIGWPDHAHGAESVEAALAEHTCFVTDDAQKLINISELDVIIESTGHVVAAVDHALQAFDAGTHIIMVTVEADALIGPVLAARAAAAGVVYSLAYGDQPALICELVDWARLSGFRVTCAGKGTKYLPEFHFSTPDTVWGYYGFSDEQVASGDYNAPMFNSFLDGTKSAIEMAAVANALDLYPAPGGLGFPPAAVDELAQVCRPKRNGGALERSGTVEVVSSLHRDGSTIAQDLRWGVYVSFEAGHEYVARCFKEYGIVTDDSGQYAALYKPAHFIGLELGVSVATVCLQGQPTGVARKFNADVVAVAKRDLKPGDRLDGEGGYTVFGKLLPSADSIEQDVLPIGMSHGLTVTGPVARGQQIRWADVERANGSRLLELRGQMSPDPGPRS